jgi:hypothetical protein
MLNFLAEKKKTFFGLMSAAFTFALVLMATGPGEMVHAAAVDFAGTTLPFTVPDMLSTSVNFLTMYGQWVLLALGVIFAPVLYGLAMKLVSAAKARTASK